MGKILGIISSSLLMTENVVTCFMLSVGAIHFEDRFCSRRRGWIIEGGGWGHLVDITDGWAVLAGCRMALHVQSFLSPSPCMSQGYRLDTFWREADEITSYLRRATQLVGELICHIGGWELAWDNIVSWSGPVAVE